MTAAADQSLNTWLKGEDCDYNKRVLQQLQGLGAHDLDKAMRDWVVGLFDAQRTRVCLVTNPSHVRELTAFFEGAKTGRKVRLIDQLSRWLDGAGEEPADDDDWADDGDDEDESEKRATPSAIASTPAHRPTPAASAAMTFLAVPAP